jgi:hypothetical protein
VNNKAAKSSKDNEEDYTKMNVRHIEDEEKFTKEK